MFLMEVRKKERRRLESAKRWSKELKNKLLFLIMENPTMFEKPTAQVYYKKIIACHKEFDEYGWKAMRDKMRNLRSSYTKALNWRVSTDNGIKEEPGDTTAREHMLKLCEDFDILQSIFASKNKTVPPSKHIGDNPCKNFMPAENVEESNKEAHLAYLAEARQDNSTYLREEHNYMTSLEESKLKLEEKWLALENQKIALERQKMEENASARMPTQSTEETSREVHLAYLAEARQEHNARTQEERNYMTSLEERKTNLEERRHPVDNQKIPSGWHKIEENSSAHIPSEIAEDTSTEAYLAYPTENRLESNDYTREERNYMSLEESKLKLEERRLALENQKIALEWHQMEENVRLRELEITNDYNLNVMRLEKEMALKELELKYKYNKE
ncbi:uncharacterized protein LOC106666512 [Cimex lectularius]|uniref:Uncharacterized protein n=1 Tax=Cimex lectularius TaxID=79782 RepID=A0A8I6RSJ6_CIMLE|nr:uncharacterized protein LOC106666512 [Cimex lectularius]